ncbi:MAG: hypothetical protein Unbinned4466contig1000_71 [Prokaryotic dsDNA virus sp.]|nr:MAG: hypothetical protein Unbinned4466contig1000_71 [Prokaryotic dsDNA virus sp.]
MALVPHKVVALNELNEGGKNTIAGAVVSLFDTEGNAVTLFDDESGANGSTAKQTDSEGVVVVYVTPGEYDEQVNGGIQRRVLVGNKEITTEQLIERIRKTRTGDVITTTGFYTAGDAGGAQWKATSTIGLTPSQSPADRGAAELVDGSGRLWSMVYGANVSVLSFGAKGDSVNDDTLPLVAAFKKAAKIFMPTGNYRVTSPITISESGVYVYGAGASRYFPDDVPAQTEIFYDGNSDSDFVIKFTSFDGASQSADCGFVDIGVDGKEKVKKGVIIQQVCKSTFSFSAAGATDVVVEFTTDRSSPSGTQYNDIPYCRVFANNDADGIYVGPTEGSLISPANVNFNTFGYMHVRHVRGGGIYLKNSDNNYFEKLATANNNTGTYGIKMQAGNGNTLGNARNNVVNLMGCIGNDVILEGTEVGPFPAMVIVNAVDSDNGFPNPTLGDETVFYFKNNKGISRNFGMYGSMILAGSEAAVIQESGKSHPHRLVVRGDNTNAMLLTNGVDGWELGVSGSGELYVNSTSGDNPLSIRTRRVKLLNTLIISGSGSPEGVEEALPGSLFLNTQGGTGSTLYVKESGTLATGWVAK